MHRPILESLARADTGDYLYLYGVYFEDVAEVTFDGLPAEVVARERGRMTVVCPTDKPAVIVAANAEGQASEPLHFPGLAPSA